MHRLTKRQKIALRHFRTCDASGENGYTRKPAITLPSLRCLRELPDERPPQQQPQGIRKEERT